MVYGNTIQYSKFSKNFFGLNNRKPSSKDIIDKHDLFKDKNINWFFSTKNKDDEELTSSDINFCKNILSSSTSAIWALQLAIYMGFKEIYLYWNGP